MTATAIPHIDINELLLSNKDAIGESVKKVLVEELKSHLSYSCSSAISDATVNFIKTEITPALKIYMDEHRAEILSEIQAGLAQVFSTAIKGMIEGAAKNLSSSYKMQKVVEGIFG